MVHPEARKLLEVVSEAQGGTEIETEVETIRIGLETLIRRISFLFESIGKVSGAEWDTEIVNRPELKRKQLQRNGELGNI